MSLIDKKVSVKKLSECLFIILIMFPFIQLRTYQELPLIIQNFYSIFEIISSSIIFVYLILKKKLKLNNFCLLIIVYVLFYIINTIINYPEGLLYCGRKMIVQLALVLFVNDRLSNKTDSMIHSLAIIYHFYIIMNIIFYIIFPNGILEPSVVSYHHVHFLGDDNALIYVIFPGIIIGIIDSYMRCGKIKIINFLEIMSCELIFIKLWTVSSFVCFSLFIMLLILNHFKKINIYFLIMSFIVIILILFFGLNLDFVQSIIVNVLHKPINLSGRVQLWEQSFKMIIQKPFFGYGGYYKFGLFKVNGGLYQCHTPFLQIIIDIGIVGATTFVNSVVICIKSIKKNYYNIISQVLSIGILCIFINYIFEYTEFTHILILLSIAFNVDKIKVKTDVKKNV